MEKLKFTKLLNENSNEDVYENLGKVTAFLNTELSLSAELMVDAYRDTTDWEEGDGVETARVEITTATNNGYGQFIPEASLSWLDENGNPIGQIVCALEAENPIVLFVYTAARWKGQGIASSLISIASLKLAILGYTSLSLYVTSTNPAVELYTKLGFVQSN